jgi:hypothetical protein
MPPLPGLMQASSTFEGPDAKFTMGTASTARARIAKQASPARLTDVIFITVSCGARGRPANRRVLILERERTRSGLSESGGRVFQFLFAVKKNGKAERDISPRSAFSLLV